MKARLRGFAKLLLLPFTWYFTKWFVDIVTRLDALSGRLDRLEDSVVQEVETAAELVLTTGRQLARLNDRLDSAGAASGTARTVATAWGLAAAVALPGRSRVACDGNTADLGLQLEALGHVVAEPGDHGEQSGFTASATSEY